MKYSNGKVSDINIAYIGGGSRGWAWAFMADLAMEESMSGTIRLYDIDEEAAKNNEIIGNILTNRKDTVGKWNYTTSPSLEAALTGADFVVISILPGTFEEMYSDVHEPEKYGIYQSVGDTAGPGGLMRALRTIPMYVEIAEAIKKYSPKAWIINYTNPMTLCMRTLYEVFPEIKAFGCCHEVFGTQKLLALMIEENLVIKNVDRRDIHVNVLGINHFTWFDEASYKGIDLFPMYEKFVERYYEEGFNEPDKNWANSSFECAHRVKFDLFKKYGLIAAAGDRHLAEFMPPIYLKDPKTVKSWKFGLTTVDWRIDDLKKRMEKSRNLATGKEDVDLKPSGEEGILLIKALVGLERVVSNVNIPNVGQITNLPLGEVVETNAVFSRDSIKPIMAGTLPQAIADLIAPHVQNHDDILKAALTCDKELAFKAFMNDPLVTISVEDGRKLFETMIENTKKYLPDFLYK
ncbi:MAG: alpha-glucosidase/alpha-galactosidase [Epulopiscium sp.]|nr:alpha-glucosidase/alpha-galactosidase [Candidatus Epulonipiscium sp.]